MKTIKSEYLWCPVCHKSLYSVQERKTQIPYLLCPEHGRLRDIQEGENEITEKA